MTSIVLTAPAKVNLVLNVLRKRKDGYHTLATLFERISLADTITISKAPRGIFVSSDKPITADPKDNIAYKAADLILKKAKVKGGVRIAIRKRIPIAAGLGGGSSDAAAVLKGINSLYGLNYNKSVLTELAGKLGADVPFFIFDAPFAVGRGRGDRLVRAGIRRRLWHLLINPGVKAATKDVYAAYDAFKAGKPTRLTRYGGGATMIPPHNTDTIDAFLHNDLEGAAISVAPVIGTIIRSLATSLSKRAIVSGSGPSVFCLYRTREEAVRAKRRLFGSVPARARKGWQVFIVETEA